MPITRIIIEGPDCAGKSTLVKALKNELHWDAKSLHHRPGNQFLRYLREYAINENTIFERAHYSEEVYSTLWRTPPFTKQEKQILDEICKLETIIILACPEIETMKARYHERNCTQQIKSHELEKTRELFLKAFKNIPHFPYVSKDFHGLEEIVKKAKGLIK